jgi:hypothetical protein
MEQTRAWGRSPRSAFLRGWPSLRQSSRWTALGRTSRCPGRAGRGRGRTRWITSIINAVGRSHTSRGSCIFAGPRKLLGGLHAGCAPATPTEAPGWVMAAASRWPSTRLAALVDEMDADLARGYCASLRRFDPPSPWRSERVRRRVTRTLLYPLKRRGLQPSARAPHQCLGRWSQDARRGCDRTGR